MSTPFPLEEQAQLERPTQYYDPEKAGPRWYAGLGFSEDTAYMGPFFHAFEGAAQGAAKGEQLMAGNWHLLASGLANLGEAVHAPAAKELRQIERTTTDFQADADARVKQLTPDAATTGAAAETIHSLASGAYRVGIGSLAGGPVGGAALMSGTETVSRYRELREAGVDELTARRAAAVAGLAGGAGALAPAAYGTTLLTRLTTGAAGNMGFGLANRYADHAILEAGGYQEMADQQRALDATQMLTDGLLGAAFGGIHHLTAGRPGELPVRESVPGLEDAALAANLALRDRALAPGVPTDPAAAGAHDAALRKATNDVLMGKPVDVSRTGVDQAEFLGRPAADGTQPRDLLLSALRESGALDEERHLQVLEEALGARLRGEKPQAGAPPVESGTAPEDIAAQIPRAKDLTESERGIETRFVEQVAGDLPAAKAAYAALEDSRGGKVLNTDTARELSPDYLTDRTQSKAVHEPASWLIKQLYAEKLAQAPGAGEEPLVLFTAGGTGAGKSTAVKSALGPMADRAQIVYDTNMNGTKSAKAKIDQALAAGKDVQIAYVHRDPTESLTQGALPRAMRQEAKYGSGRTVPIEEHIGTHVGANETIRDLVRDYANNPRVKFALIDNSHGQGNARGIQLAELPRLDYNLSREQASQALEAELAAGRISSAVYRGFAGREPGSQPTGPGGPAPAAAVPGERREPGEPARLVAGTGRQPEPQRPGERPDQLAEVATATGRKIQVQPKLVEASDLVTSDRSKYPAELQPRQRGARVALEEQVRDIAKNLEPARLGASAEADRGAPITGPDNVVESGNGRVLALRQVYEGSPEKAEAYREFLKSQGYDITGMKQPVLVRERVTPMTDEERRAFTVEANQAATAALSPVERAQADARLLDGGVLAQMRSGELSSVGNASFVRAFMERIPQAERNAMVNPDGTVSQEGVRRLQSAVLAKAYGGAAESNAVLGRMLESTDSDMRSTLGALLDAAPAFARLRQAIEEGKVGAQYDLARALTQAVEAVAQVREKGQALGEFLKQSDFLTKRPPVVEALMRALYDRRGERIAGRDAVAQKLMNYADRALKQRLDQGMLFGDAPASPEHLLATGEPREEEGAAMRPSADMFGLRTPQGAREPTTQLAQSVLRRTPNLEIVGDDGTPERGRAELLGAQEEAVTTSERAPGALETVADCAAQRAA